MAGRTPPLVAAKPLVAWDVHLLFECVAAVWSERRVVVAALRQAFPFGG